MAYVPDPTDGTEPLDSVDASTAAAEFRALKTYIQTSGIGGQSGDIIPSGAANRIGCVLCDGTAYSRTDPTYAALFAAVGIKFGAGNGTTTFNVPDARGRTLFGHDPSNTTGRLNNAATGGISATLVGNVGGVQTHTQLATEIATHNHNVAITIHDPGHAHTFVGTAHTHAYDDPKHTHTVSDPGHDHTYSKGVINSSTSLTVVTGTTATNFYNPTNTQTSSDTTGVTNAISATGITINNATAGGTIINDTTGITTSNTVGNAGSSAAMNIINPGIVVNYFIKL